MLTKQLAALQLVVTALLSLVMLTRRPLKAVVAQRRQKRLYETAVAITVMLRHTVCTVLALLIALLLLVVLTALRRVATLLTIILDTTVSI
jgi:hypothetical protein